MKKRREDGERFPYTANFSRLCENPLVSMGLNLMDSAEKQPLIMQNYNFSILAQSLHISF
jgi:hypothetical protein